MQRKINQQNKVWQKKKTHKRAGEKHTILVISKNKNKKKKKSG